MKQQTDHQIQEDDQDVDIANQPVVDDVILEVEMWKQKYLRTLADYQNLERRTNAEKEQMSKYAAEGTLKKILPIVDMLEQAVQHIDDQGLKASLKEFDKALQSCGAKKLITLGEQFDPFTMECIEVVTGEDGIVVEELSSGYLLHDKLLRVAKVKVGKQI